MKRGNFAFFMESNTVEYVLQEHCELIQLGSSLLDEKNYAIATPVTSPYTNVLSEAIVHLKETGKLSELKERWWRVPNNNNNNNNNKGQTTKGKGTICPENVVSSIGQNLIDIGGIFFLLLVGSGFACIMVIIELIWKTKKVVRVSGPFIVQLTLMTLVTFACLLFLLE